MATKDPFLSGRRIGWTAAVLLGAAAFATMAWLRDGMPGAGGFEARMAHIGAHRGAWVFGWLVRMLAAGFLLAFLTALTRALTPGHPILRTVAVHLVAIGVAAELLAATISATVLPALAPRLANGPEGLAAAAETVEIVAASLSGVLGIGLISVGGALVAHAAFRTPPFSRFLACSSLPVWAVGVAAAGATLAGGKGGAELVTFVFLPILAVWTAGVAASFFRPPANA